MPATKIHQLHYIPVLGTGDADSEYLALSTEDGRIIFYRTDVSTDELNEENSNDELKILQPIAQFGGPSDGLTGRIKDFEVLRLPGAREFIIIACGSDGAIRLWLVEDIELTDAPAIELIADADKPKGVGGSPNTPEPVGQLIGLYESRNRITCVTAFFMSKQSIHGIHGPLAVRDGDGSGRNQEAEDIAET